MNATIFLVGGTLGIRAIISVHGQVVSELKSEFVRAVDDCLNECKETGESPEKPASGKRLSRLPPQLHGQAMVLVQGSGKSRNQWVNEVLQRALAAG